MAVSLAAAAAAAAVTAGLTGCSALVTSSTEESQTGPGPSPSLNLLSPPLLSTEQTGGNTRWNYNIALALLKDYRDKSLLRSFAKADCYDVMNSHHNSNLIISKVISS